VVRRDRHELLFGRPPRPTEPDSFRFPPNGESQPGDLVHSFPHRAIHERQPGRPSVKGLQILVRDASARLVYSRREGSPCAVGGSARAAS
jgi:hypothetical protein